MNWNDAATFLEDIAKQSKDEQLDHGQRAAVLAIADRIRSGKRAVLLADEVGMGKTRIAVALVTAVRRAGGRAAIVLPAGLGAQWQKELRLFQPDDRTLLPLRSYEGFIEGFLTDADEEGSANAKVKHRNMLRHRRQQRELPEHGWAEEQTLMISHTFANMRFPKAAGAPAEGWRRELLPNVTRLLAGQRRNFMRKRFDSGELGRVAATRRAAQSIAATIAANNLQDDPDYIAELQDDHKWLDAYEYKQKILRLIGFGLGRFDLIVIDEAHKARGADSSLSRILGPVTWAADDAFRLGMTATPVELDASQWIDTLSRISGRDDHEDITGFADLELSIRAYVETVKRLQVEELDTALVEDFEKNASKFQKDLEPFVLRRDKRLDPEFREFQDVHGDYRVVEDLEVSPSTKGFDRQWLRGFCAAEALSMLPQNDPAVKRARLSMAQGYGFASLTHAKADQASKGGVHAGPKDFWLEALHRDGVDIHSHPATLAVVQLIETYTSNQQKVLVFGRFLEALNAVTRLLDAREMLRRVMRGAHWPAARVRQESEAAVHAALQDPEFAVFKGDIARVKDTLSEGYRTWSNARRRELEGLRRDIFRTAESEEDVALLAEFLRRDHDDSDQDADFSVLLEALSDRRVDPGARWTLPELQCLFRDLLSELTSTDEKSDNATVRSALAQYLKDYSGREGNFARLMSGTTQPQTRRTLQSAFNRSSSWPMVLLAQSLVGREGLNLHEACRCVVLLHAEWNPGIVEQQIGRVDRKGSLWLKDVSTWKASRTHNPPRIHIHPVVVSGTYDDHNWQVLKTRWLELRAQLHGDVLPKHSGRTVDTPEFLVLQNRVREATPDFSPKPFQKVE